MTPEERAKLLSLIDGPKGFVGRTLEDIAQQMGWPQDATEAALNELKTAKPLSLCCTWFPYDADIRHYISWQAMLHWADRG